MLFIKKVEARQLSNLEENNLRDCLMRKKHMLFNDLTLLTIQLTSSSLITLALWYNFRYNRTTLLSNRIEDVESMNATCTVFSLPVYKATAHFLWHSRTEHL